MGVDVGINTIKIKKVVRPLDLADYEPEYAGTVIQVWVNPPRKCISEVAESITSWEKATLERTALEKPSESEENPDENSTKGASEYVPIGSKEEIASAREAEQEAKLAYYDWFAQVWEDSSKEDIRALVEKLEAQEPGMLKFLRDRTLQMIADYASARKKA